jgi:hypothetical protein
MRHFSFIILFLIVTGLRAQISFPDGNVNNLVTGEHLLYLETRILFHTGQFKANDYRWEKVSDSLDQRWLVTACFNGDCKNDLLQSGDFIMDYGLNDTTCFIAFHVESYGYEGTSKIKYNVYNKNQPADSASLHFRITYTDVTKTPDLVPVFSGLNVFPNPATDILNISQGGGNLNGSRILISDISGQNLVNLLVSHDTEQFPIDVDHLQPGIYLVTIQNHLVRRTLKLAIQ